jgi:hypothetical protein
MAVAQKIQAVKQGAPRTSKVPNHLAAIAEGIGALNWVTVVRIVPPTTFFLPVAPSLTLLRAKNRKDLLFLCVLAYVGCLFPDYRRRPPVPSLVI